MAKQRNGINDAFRGSVGTVIGYEWRGQWCMRARPRYVHNPRTVAFRACGEGLCACADDEVYVAAFCPARGEVAMSGSVWR